MAPQSKGADWTTTFRSTQARRLKLEQFRQKRAAQLKISPSEISLSDMINEAIDHLVDYDNDLEGSKMALAYEVGEKIAEGQAVLSTQVLALTRLLLEVSRRPKTEPEYLDIVRDNNAWAVRNYAQVTHLIVDQRKAAMQATRAANEQRRQAEQAQIEATRQQKARAEAEAKYLDTSTTSNPSDSE